MRLWAPEKRKGMALLKPVFAVFFLISLVLLRTSPFRIYVRRVSGGIHVPCISLDNPPDPISRPNPAQSEDAPRVPQHRVGALSPVESTYTVGTRPFLTGS